MHSPTPIQLAVLRVMGASGNDYAQFEAVTMDKYRKAMRLAGLSPKEVNADVPGAQQALIALQEKSWYGGQRAACMRWKSRACPIFFCPADCLTVSNKGRWPACQSTKPLSPPQPTIPG